MIVENVNKQELQKFGFILAFMISTLFGAFFPFVFDFNFPKWPWIVSIILTLWAIIIPTTLQQLYKGWMFVGEIVGKINTKIILSLLFYLIFLPMGLALKILGKDPMNRNLDKKIKTYRELRDKDSFIDMEKPY